MAPPVQPPDNHQQPPQPPPTLPQTSITTYTSFSSIKVSNPNLNLVGFDFYLSFDSYFVILIIDHDVLIRIRAILNINLDVLIVG